MSGTEGEVLRLDAPEEEHAGDSAPAHAELPEHSERMFENIWLKPLPYSRTVLAINTSFIGREGITTKSGCLAAETHLESGCEVNVDRRVIWV